MKHCLQKILLAICLLALSACQQDGAQLDAKSQSTATAVISLSPVITETMFALGVGDRLIARSDYCNQPAAALDLPTVGSSLTPNFEKIANLKPDLILGEKTNTSYHSELAALSMTEELPWTSLDDLREGVLLLADKFGVVERGQQLIATIDDAFIVADQKSELSIIVLLDSVFDGSTIWAIKSDSVHGAAIRATGVKNVMDEFTGSNPSLSLEGLIQLNPDIIIVLTTDNSDSHRQQILSGIAKLSSLDAIQNKRIAIISGEHVFSTGPSVIEFVTQLKLRIKALMTDNNHDIKDAQLGSVFNTSWFSWLGLESRS